MSGFALVLAALPAAGNFAGGLAGDLVKVSERTLSLALHLAAGIVLAVVGLELVPQGLASSAPWVPIVAFATGGAAFVGIERAVDALRGRLGAGEESTGPLAIFTGWPRPVQRRGDDRHRHRHRSRARAAAGPGSGAGRPPRGLRRGGHAAPRRLRPAHPAAHGCQLHPPRARRATLGWFALRGAPELVTLSVLALTGGVLTAVVIEQMIDEAHDAPTSGWGPVALTTGFAIFAALSVYLGW